MTFVDAGYLVALGKPTDALHERAWAWSRALPGPYLVTEHVLIEASNLMSSPRDRGRAHAIVRTVTQEPDWEYLPAVQEMFNAGLRLHAQRPDKAWSLTDCISFIVMEQRGVTRALAYDHHFEQAGFDPLLRREPA